MNKSHGQDEIDCPIKEQQIAIIHNSFIIYVMFCRAFSFQITGAWRED